MPAQRGIPDIFRVGSRQVRATNARLKKEIGASVKERRRLTEEVLGPRAVAEERPIA